tara:strand:- start:835 stop:1080 length:246 start_codon:yes stop_codon:yes gene_type:complete
MKIWNTDIYQGANKATLASMKKFELQKAQAEKLAEAHKLKTRYEFYKAEYGADDALTIRLRERALKMWHKSESLRKKVEAL